MPSFLETIFQNSRESFKDFLRHSKQKIRSNQFLD